VTRSGQVCIHAYVVRIVAVQGQKSARRDEGSMTRRVAGHQHANSNSPRELQTTNRIAGFVLYKEMTRDVLCWLKNDLIHPFGIAT
jgi:hypothetical protein